jgi:hypothetical protein
LVQPRALAISRSRSSLVGASWIVVGLTVALVTIPSDTQAPGALELPALLLGLSIIAGMVSEMVSVGMAAGFAAKYIILLGVIYFLLLDAFQPDIVMVVPRDAVVYSFICIALFAVAVHAGASFRAGMPKGIKILASRELPLGFLNLQVVLFFVLGTFYYVYSAGFSLAAIANGLFADRWGAPWARTALGDSRAFLEHLTYFGFLLPTLTVLIAYKVRTLRHASVLLGAVLSLGFLVFVFQGGGRRLVGEIIGCAVLTALIKERHRIGFRGVAITLAAVVVLLVGMEVMLFSRVQGLDRTDLGEFSMTTVHVDDNLLRLAQTVDLVPRQYDYVGVRWLMFVLVRPVPRAWWTGKPTDSGFDLAASLGITTVALTRSVVGESYSAFGWAGVLAVGLFLGFLSGKWSSLLSLDLSAFGAALYSFGVFPLFLAVRSLDELVLQTYPLLFWLLAIRILGGSKKVHARGNGYVMES